MEVVCLEPATAMSEDVRISQADRVIEVMAEGGSPLKLKVPSLLGQINSAELRGEFVLVRTAGGRISYHAATPKHVNNITWRREHSLRGKMHWHSMLKVLRTHCLLADVAPRISFHITQTPIIHTQVRIWNGAIHWYACGRSNR